MKRHCALILLFGSFQISFGQWVLQPTVTTADLYQVRFIDRNTGLAVGQFWTQNGIYTGPANKSSILRTTDGGNSWTEQVLNNSLLWGLSIVNRSIGWAVGRTASGSGLILKTTDVGDSWFLVDSSATRSHFYSLQFLDELHGWIGGWNDTTGFVARTTDAGLSWHTAYDKSLDVNELFFLDAMTGWDVGENGNIYGTSDGGSTWQVVFQAPVHYEPLRRIRFFDRMHGCAVGGIAGTETKVWTSDGGLSWNVVQNSPPTPGSSLHGLWFNDANNGWCIGGVNAGLTIQRTVDGGQTWVKQQLPSTLSSVKGLYYLEDVTFVSPTEGWIVGDVGTILKTTNAGDPATGIANDGGDASVSKFQLNQNYPNPFNPSTTINYSLPRTANVSLRIFNALGQELASIVNERKEAGQYQAAWNASNVPSGIYFYRLQAGEFLDTKKMLLLR
jgi:photosystem II stability/assembly factor-like uncharacterized protein